MTSRVALGIDIGTSGTRACVIDERGTTLEESRSDSPPFLRPRPGWSEHDPEIWWNGLVACVQQLDRHLRESITDIAVDATSSSLCLSDKTGDAITPALMYGDARATAQAALIKVIAPPDSVAHGASSSLAKALWLCDQYGAHNARILHQADWVNERLGTRKAVTDYNNALKLGYDPVNQCWPEWVLSLLDLEVPKVVAPGCILGEINGLAAKALGLPNAPSLHAGTTDSTAAFVATGACSAGEAVTSIGSTLVIKVLSTKPVFAPEYGVYSHRLGKLWLVGGASNSGGRVLLNWFTPDELKRLSAHINPLKPTGLDYYPLLLPGERFPVNDPDYPPRLAPKPEDRRLFLQALLEGIASIESQAYHCLERLGTEFPRRILTVGGGAKNEAWSEIRRNMLGCDVIKASHQEAAYGAALLALSTGVDSRYSAE